MAVTRALVEERLARLRAGLARLEADRLATQGAVDECEHWLSVLDAEAERARPHAAHQADGVAWLDGCALCSGTGA